MDSMMQGQLKEWFVLLAFWGLLGWAGYLGASIIRRKQKSDMQKALLEKFSSAHGFAEFMQSPAGQKYLLSFADCSDQPTQLDPEFTQDGLCTYVSGGRVSRGV